MDRAVYPISVTAEPLDVHPRTLMLYEKHGFITPKRKANKRLYSNNDLQWIQCIREMIHDQGLNITGLQCLLSLLRCWQIKRCTGKERQRCSSHQNTTAPCWEVARNICPEKTKLCRECEVYEKQHGKHPKQL